MYRYNGSKGTKKSTKGNRHEDRTQKHTSALESEFNISSGTDLDLSTSSIEEKHTHWIMMAMSKERKNTKATISMALL